MSPQYHLYKKLLTEHHYLWCKVWITEPVLKAVVFFLCYNFGGNLRYIFTLDQLPLTCLTI